MGRRYCLHLTGNGSQHIGPLREIARRSFIEVGGHRAGNLMDSMVPAVEIDGHQGLNLAPRNNTRSRCLSRIPTPLDLAHSHKTGISLRGRCKRTQANCIAYNAAY
jgi:hypothetical protein